MAATRLIPLHLSKGRTMAQCLKDKTDYSENAKKQIEGNILVHINVIQRQQTKSSYFQRENTFI